MHDQEIVHSLPTFSNKDGKKADVIYPTIQLNNSVLFFSFKYGKMKAKHNQATRFMYLFDYVILTKKTLKNNYPQWSTSTKQEQQERSVKPYLPLFMWSNKMDFLTKEETSYFVQWLILSPTNILNKVRTVSKDNKIPVLLLEQKDRSLVYQSNSFYYNLIPELEA